MCLTQVAAPVALSALRGPGWPTLQFLMESHRVVRWIGLATIGLALFFVGLTQARAAPVAQASNSQICVLAFDDQNGNGVQDSGEMKLGGVGFTLSDASGVKGVYSTDGSSEPYCFGNLAASQYNVRARAPQGYESTTAGQWVIPLAAGAEFDVKYGARGTGAAPATDNQSNSSSSSTPSSSSGPSTFARILLGGLGVIILLVAGFMAGAIVQRSRGS